MPDQEPGKSNRQIPYRCTQCGREVGRSNLKVKQVVFKEMGISGTVVRARVIGWLCIIKQAEGSASCLDSDEHYNRVALSSSPGMADTKLTKVAS